jgi:phosphoglycolate phosphatase-like HAD superfamily hydrolase
MIGEDLSERETVVRVGREQEPLAPVREAITPQDRFKRHGHLPAIFLLPNRDFLPESAERALFDNGFETITVDGDQIPYASVKSLLDPLWSAGLLVLFAAGNISVETRRTLETLAGDSLFDFVTAEPRVTHQDLASRILSQAASLRLSQNSWTSEKED